MKNLIILVAMTFSLNLIASNKACDRLTKKINSKMKTLNTCNQDLDCVVEPIYTCPFGCYVFKNNAINTEKLHALLDEYSKSCSPCVYRCARPPEHLKCVEGHCSPN